MIKETCSCGATYEASDGKGNFDDAEDVGAAVWREQHRHDVRFEPTVELSTVHVASETDPTNEEIAGRILRRAIRCSLDEFDALWDAWIAIPYDDRRRAGVSGYAGSGAIGGAFALYAVVSSYAATNFGAALAVLARDSRSESGPFTPEHYEILTRPWRIVIGAVHPDDDLPTGEDAR